MVGGMDNPDRPPDELLRSVEHAAEEMRRAVLAAYTKGLRDGCEMCATLTQGMIDSLTMSYPHDMVIAAVLTMARDHLRLLAFQVETPA